MPAAIADPRAAEDDSLIRARSVSEREGCSKTARAESIVEEPSDLRIARPLAGDNSAASKACHASGFILSAGAAAATESTASTARSASTRPVPTIVWICGGRRLLL